MDFKEQLIRELDKLDPREVHMVSAAAAAPIGGRKMTKYHAVMLDETGMGEFGVSVEAETKSEAYAILREDYCESHCVQLESPEDTALREKLMYEEIEREIDNPDYWEDEDMYEEDR